ncbi:MAG: lysophospholipase [Lachnospiraceae bacterium]|nr:lysophospholipase [Lachnospiraceae bacterium]
MAEEWQLIVQRRMEGFHDLNMKAVKGQVCFAGSSLMEQFPIEEFVNELSGEKPIVYNRGLGGYTTIDMLKVVDVCVTELKPSKLFINIGTNDLSHPDWSLEEIMDRYEEIINIIERDVPGIKIYFMAYYPGNIEAAADYMKDVLAIRNNDKIAEANKLVEKLAAKHGQRYIDVNDPLKDEYGRLKAEYSQEGLHIKPEGYRAIFDEVLKYVME